MKVLWNKQAFENGFLCHNCQAALDIDSVTNGVCTCDYCGSTWIVEDLQNGGVTVSHGGTINGVVYESASAIGYIYSPKLQHVISIQSSASENVWRLVIGE